MNQVFININLSTLYDSKRKKIRVRPTSGQNVPVLWVSCSKKQRNQMIVGTVFKTDVKLIESNKRKPYLKATKKILGQLSLFQPPLNVPKKGLTHQILCCHLSFKTLEYGEFQRYCFTSKSIIYQPSQQYRGFT